MADEGNKSEGQENTEAQPSNDSTQHLTTQHIGTYAELMYDNKAESVARNGGWISTGWAQAVAKDERADRVQKARYVSRAQPSRSRESLRAEFRARQDWDRTVRGIHRQYWYTPPSQPREPYSKGQDGTWLDQLAGWFWRLWGLE